MTISGTASDVGGEVAGVEVSTDNGVSWHLASGRSSWSYTWNVQQFGAATLRSRVVDDSGNIKKPRAGVRVHIKCPCQLWSASVTPDTVDGGDPGANVELGTKFTADVSGSVTGVRFYKSAENTGTHTGSLWNAGKLLATVTFAGESESGWQQATFSTPVKINAGQTYVVSYHTTVGHYSLDSNYFDNQYRSGPLHVPASGTTSGGNGVYHYGTSAFPNESFHAANYWVDLVFETKP